MTQAAFVKGYSMKKVLALLLLFMLYIIPSSAEESASPFLEKGTEPILTDFSYQSENIVINISSLRACDSDVYIADVYVRSVDYFQRFFAGGKWGTKTQKISTIAESSGAILALTGDSGQNFTAGWIVANGVIERNTRNRKRDLCLLLKDGSMAFYPAGSVTQEQLEASSESIWHSFLFGPVLLNEEGKALDDFSNSNVQAKNPRAVLGYYEPGHYCFVQVDGRSIKSALEEGERNHGMTLKELAAFMEEIGCSGAYNLDGGRSAAMWFNGKVISTQAAADRRIGDIMVIKELE